MSAGQAAGVAASFSIVTVTVSLSTALPAGAAATGALLRMSSAVTPSRAPLSALLAWSAAEAAIAIMENASNFFISDAVL